MFKDAIILDTIQLSLWLIQQQQQQCLPKFELILDGRLSHHLLPAPFHVKIMNTT
jgi:hypothetical protein